MKRPLAYITAAWCGIPEVDTDLAVEFCRAAYEAGLAPICPKLYLPLILNDSNEGGDWKDHQVSAELVYGRHKKTKLGSEKLYEVSDEILQKNIKKGNLKE